MSPEPRLIYVLERDGLLKIGCSRNPAQRARHFGATLIGAVPGTFADERRLHAALAAHRVEGEWFRDTGPVRELAESWRDLPWEPVVPTPYTIPPGPPLRLNGAALRAIRSRTIDPHTGFPYTVSGFAGAVGCQQPHVTLLEQDARKASRTLLAKIVTALDVPPAAVMWAPPPQGKTVAAEAVA